MRPNQHSGTAGCHRPQRTTTIHHGEEMSLCLGGMGRVIPLLTNHFKINEAGGRSSNCYKRIEAASLE
ncbi:MAG: hypothetical protein GY696_33920 [Gammaproteobacteria bacterium]|nr:hypothetical protein [Gammaproteobacteria bacterium]